VSERDATGSFRKWLGVVVGCGLLFRLIYLFSQWAAGDPFFSRPSFDGAYYFDWARAIVAGEGGPEGAFYLAPLYAYCLALFFRIAGESHLLLYILQTVLSAVAAAALASGTRRLVGGAAALCGAALFLLFQPLVYFAARPLGETLAIALLCLALAALARESPPSAALGGLLLGAASLARPNLLLVAAAWGLLLLVRRRPLAAVALGAGLLVVVLPVAARNGIVSGHPVPISSNAGITLYHGNGPGALGTFTPPAGMSGALHAQQAEATRRAGQLAATELDAVDADRFWGREAIRTRLADPAGSLTLLLNRLLLVWDNEELGLDYYPYFDASPLFVALPLAHGRHLMLFPLPLCLLLWLATAGVALRGFKGTGGATLWLAVAACAATPVLFYVSSRYRLPAVALLALPAGCGLVGLFHEAARASRARRWGAWTLGLLAAMSSLWLFPLARPDLSREIQRQQGAQVLLDRALAYRDTGRIAEAVADAERALAMNPESPLVQYNYGVVRRAEGREDLAEEAFRTSLFLQPGFPPAAGDLAQLLIERRATGEAISLLQEALRRSPHHAVCWTNLVVALALEDRTDEAIAAFDRAGRAGVALPQELRRELEGGP